MNGRHGTASRPDIDRGIASDVVEVKERLTRIETAIGDAPNPATGTRGSGMMRILAEIAGNRRGHFRLSGATISVTIAIVVLEVLTRFGLIPPSFRSTAQRAESADVR